MGYDEKKEKDMADIQEGFKVIQKNLEKTWAITQENAKSHRRERQKYRGVEAGVAEPPEQARRGRGNRLGEIVETIARENIARLLQDYGIDVNHVHGNIKDVKNRKWELDAVAVNGEEVVVVETKATLTCGDVHAFIENRLKNVREYLPGIEDKKVYGAVAYFRAKDSAKYGDPVKMPSRRGCSS